MTNTQHTPGPWHTEGCGDGTTVCDRNGLVPLAHNLSEANARLIAAAPDLLAVARHVEECRINGWPLDFQMVRAAIAKAIGSEGV